jgi:hypothetical protein
VSASVSVKGTNQVKNTKLDMLADKPTRTQLLGRSKALSDKKVSVAVTDKPTVFTDTCCEVSMPPPVSVQVVTDKHAR